MKKMRFIAVVMVLSASLAGCFESLSGTVTPDTGFHSYATEDFQVFIPNEWDVLTKMDFGSDIPASTVAAFRSNIKSPVFTPTVVVLRNELKDPMRTLDYAKLLHAKIAQDIVGYKEVDVSSDQISLKGKPEESLFLYVEGKESETADAKRFMQRIAVKDNRGYIITGAFPANADSGTADMVEKIVKSFEVK